MKRITSLLLAFAMVFCVGIYFPTETLASGVDWTTGEGTEQSPYIIDSLEKLKAFRDAVNGGNHFNGKYLAVTEDITMDSESWTPIAQGTYKYNVGSATVYFGGTLYGAKTDGTPAVIRGLTINSTDETTAQQAFIGTNTGTVSNLRFENATVNAKRYAAVIVGLNFGTVKDCETDASCKVTLDSHVDFTSIGHDTSSSLFAPSGGISAENRGVITNCVNRADVTSDYTHVGGIAGQNTSAISYCTNYGDITAVATAGGIVGHLWGHTAIFGTVSYSGNMGNVTAIGSHIGGIVGWSRESAGIAYCYNTGTISGTVGEGSETITDTLSGYSKYCVGGILGNGNKNSAEVKNTYVIEYCYNIGDVYVAGTQRTEYDVTVSAPSTCYRGNYGIYSGYTEGLISKADAASGALCEFLNDAMATTVFTQNIGVDTCPVIKGDVSYVKLELNENGTYTVPALVGYVSEEGSLVGFRDQNGNVHKAGEEISYKYVSPVYEKLLTLKYGAAVRVVDSSKTGLRWTATVDKDAIAAGGYTITDKGFIIAPTAYVTGEWAVVDGKNVKAKKVADDFTVEAFEAEGIDYIDVKVSGYTDFDSTTFAAAVTNLYEENFSLGYSARAYLDVEDASGNTMRVYSGFEDANGEVFYSYGAVKQNNSRAPGQIAKLALADVKETLTGKYCYRIETAEDAFLAADSGKYTKSAYYSPYNAKARQNLYEFILTDPAKPETEKVFYPQYDSAAEYSDMRAELKAWIMGKIDANGDTTVDGSLFTADLLYAKGFGGKNGSTSADREVPYATLLSSAAKSLSSTTKNGNEEITVTYTYDELVFTTTIILYSDTPTADIKTTVKNTSSQRSAVIRNFNAVDGSFSLAHAGGDIKLTTLVGSYASSNDFNLVERNLGTEYVAPVLGDYTYKDGTTRKNIVVTNENTVFYPTGDSDGLGYSSSGHGFPYFELTGNNKGLMMAIGWTGQWEASFKKDTAGNAVFQAKQQHLKTYLEKGEEIEAPRIVLTYYEGEHEYGQNVWREMMLSHYTPDNDNDLTNENAFEAPISANFWGGIYSKTIMESVQNLVDAKADFNLVWLDAGWYGDLLYSSTAAFNTNTAADKAAWETFIAANPKTEFNKGKAAGASLPAWAQYRGDYIENDFLFPNGIEEMGGFVNTLNVTAGYEDLKFMLWYMIFDRSGTHSEYLYPDGTVVEAAGDTPLQFVTAEEIAQYGGTYPNLANLVKSDFLSAGVSSRIDLSKDSVLNKLIDYYKFMMDVKGVDAVRLDNSQCPLVAWRNTDVHSQNDNRISHSFLSKSPGASGLDDTDFFRDGYTENRSVVNEYKLWDALKAYNADFFLDNTASGGRRLDIEMVRRSVALWRSDYNDPSGDGLFYSAHQNMTQNLSMWVPLSAAGYVVGVGTYNADNEEYNTRSLYSAAVNINGPAAYDTSTERFSRMVKSSFEMADLRPYWYGNYYQLLPAKLDTASWQSYELYREDWNEGVFVVICRADSTVTEDESAQTLTKTVKLKGLKNCAMYRIHDIDDETGANDIVLSGAELMSKGVTVTSSTTREINTYKIILED